MSGGVFDYNCFRISQFAEELKNKLDEDNGKLNLNTLYRLKLAHSYIKLAGELAHDIEWFYSGDIGEDTLEKRFNEHLKDFNLKMVD